MSRQAVPGPTPRGPYSPGIVAEGKLVFVSGQGPLRDGVYVEGAIAEETQLTLDNLLAVLAASGCSAEDVVCVATIACALAGVPVARVP